MSKAQEPGGAMISGPAETLLASRETLSEADDDESKTESVKQQREEEERHEEEGA